MVVQNVKNYLIRMKMGTQRRMVSCTIILFTIEIYANLRAQSYRAQ